MKLKNILKIFIIFQIFIVLTCTTCTEVFAAASKTTLTKQLNQTNNKRAYYQNKKKQADLRLKSERNKLSSNQQKLEIAQGKLATTTNRYNALVSDLTVMEQRLSVAVNEFRTIDGEMKERIRQVFKYQRSGMFELILSAKDVNALMDMFYYAKLIIRSDYKKMQALKSKADEIAALKAGVESQKRIVEASIRDIKAQRMNIQNSIAVNKSMINRLQKDKSYYERSERELAKQSANIQNMIAGLSKQNAKPGSTPVKAATGGFIYPISGPITSPFGWRIHPIFKSRIFHSGIDIGGPNGGAIKASNDGRVIYSGWYGGYGKVVIIDHGVIGGKPITTLYAHLSVINASNGQNVKKGQIIGREGSTGYSTGPHCHFEVRVNGKPTNPLNYI